MAPAEGLSAPGSATYDSSTMTVGDGTWDFTKNDFLLPNLVGLNFATMRYNGMGNRFSTLTQYHTLVTGHGVIAAITFLFIIPAAILYARFNRNWVTGRRMHAYLQVLAVLLSTVVFVLGWFAVGPNRSLTNPHHGIGVAIYTMILVQAIGGRLVKNIQRRSLRLMLHRWIGRAVAILGIVQVPLGLTLYGSPKFTFILYSIWMAFLVLLYFILSWRRETYREEMFVHGGRSESGYLSTEHRSEHSHGWLGPLAAGAGLLTLLRGGKKGPERSRSDSRARAPPEVISSRRNSASLSDEKFSDRSEHREGGLMNKLLGVLGVLGAGALVKRIADRRERRRYDDEEYSAVSTDTPSRYRAHNTRPIRKAGVDDFTESDITEDRTDLGGPRPRDSLLPGPGRPSTGRPSTPPRPSHARLPASNLSSQITSDYSSYISPSRRRDEESHVGAGKGLLAVPVLGWFANKMRIRRESTPAEERLRYEEERRDGRHGSRFTGDGFGTPTRSSKLRSSGPPETATSFTHDTESSMVEARPTGTGLSGPPMPPFGAEGTIPIGITNSEAHRSKQRRDTGGPAKMPPMPADRHGVLHSLRPGTDSESYISADNRQPERRRSHRRRSSSRGGTDADLSAVEEGNARRRDRSAAPSQPVSLKIKYHDDRDRNVTLRRLTDDEAKRERRRRRSNSMSSMSGSETPGRRRYRRDSSSARRSANEKAAERLVDNPLAAPTPAFAGGRRHAGPSGTTPAAAQTVTSDDSPGSHGTWSAMSPSSPPGDRPAGSAATSAAERRRRRQQERRQPMALGTVDFT
ncbi:hypothetical protein F4780DRAFT_730208 [Xylariomycetidae sp. FL0641]|nr:hypothetical protein F4780DRAFT_730208 [Xylariomycetidae sp. FL0641]